MTDLINGTNKSEFIDALWPKRIIGNDERINGLGGNDFIYGYDGDDGLYGGAGNDTVYGDGGSDFLSGGADNDLLQGHAGSDVLDGGDGHDTASYIDKAVGVTVTLNGTFGASVYVGGVLEDLIRNIEGAIGGSGNDDLVGDGVGNMLEGNAGDDNLRGAGGSDYLLGGLGGDGLIGGGDGDILRGEGGQDFLDGGAGFDEASYSEKTAGVTVTLNSTFGVNVYVGGVFEDLIRNFEGVFGGAGQDVLTGDGLANMLDGNANADVLNGGGGADQLHGDLGDDRYVVDQQGDSIFETAGEGSDTLVSPITSYVLAAGVSVETMTTANAAGTAVINLTGNEFGQLIAGNAAANRLEGRGGIDTARGFAGNDTYIVDNAGDVIVEIAGQGTNDVLLSPLTSYTLAAGVAVEIMGTGNSAGTAVINFTGNEFGQLIMGNAAANRLEGRGGSDTLQGFAGNDTLNGGAGNDTLAGGLDTDRFVFRDGDGADTVNDFADTLERFDLTGLVTGAQNFAQLVVTDTAGPGVTVNYGTGSFLIANINTVSLIGAGDFLY